MENNTEEKIIKLFTDKIESITKMFEKERQKQQKRLNMVIYSFLIFILMIAFSTGYNMNKLNSLEHNHYEVYTKVEMLYMVALKKGDITLDMMGAEILTRSGNKKYKNK